MHLCLETQPSVEEISQLFGQTFSDSEGKAEGELIAQLVRDLLTTTSKDELLCFTARKQNKLLGSIIFSRLTFPSNLSAMLLSPVAVKTQNQRQGIGQSLIQFALQRLKQDEIELVMTYGDPNYYGKVGFKTISEEVVPSPMPLSMPQGWLGQMLTETEVPKQAKPRCVSAFQQPSLW